MQLEVAQLVAEVDRVATQTTFNGTRLLDGSFTAQQFQVGANVGQTIGVASIAGARSSTLGVYQGFSAAGQSIAGLEATPQALTVTVASARRLSRRDCVEPMLSRQRSTTPTSWGT